MKLPLHFAPVTTEVAYLPKEQGAHRAKYPSNRASASPSRVLQFVLVTIGFIHFLFPLLALAQTEYLGTITAAQVSAGLGFNLTTSNAWEWQAAAAAGATHGRIQCSWVSTEGQASPPADTSTGYSLQSDCVAALTSAKTYGINPTIVAAFGAPYHQILTVTVPAGAASGATSVGITFSSGVGGSTIASMRSIWNAIGTASGVGFLSPAHDYAGVIITNVNVTSGTTATLTLASALTNALPANGTTYLINEYLYQPPATASPTNAYVEAYANYVVYLAQQVNAGGLAGDIEIWNEPPWPDSCWDNLGDCYDTYSSSPATIGAGYPNFGFAARIQALTLSSGVTGTWAGTNKSGSNTLLGGNLNTNSGVALAQPTVVFQAESIHPYGNNPEQSMWSKPCLVAAAPSGYNSGLLTSCAIMGSLAGNTAEGPAYDAVAKYSNANYGITHSITETGFQNTQGTQVQAARYILRQFLGYQAAGATPIEFYRLYDTSQSFGFGTYSGSTFTPYQQYTSIQALMSDVKSIAYAAPATVSSTNLIASYSGTTWPLDSMQIVGARSAADTVNSVLVAAWQRTYLTSASSQAQWASVASPAAGNVVVNIPASTVVKKVVDTVTLANVSYTTASNQITVPVADDPIEMLFEPSGTVVGPHNLQPLNGKFN